MGQLNDHEPANTRAITHSRLGMGRETQRFGTIHYPNPARSGTCGYPFWLRTKAINFLDTQGRYRFAAHRHQFDVGSEEFLYSECQVVGSVNHSRVYISSY